MKKDKKKTILVLGYFGYITNQLDGQTVKTREVFKLLESKIDSSKLLYFDTQIFNFNRFSIFNFLYHIYNCNIIVYLPAQNNLKFLFPIIFLISIIKRISIHYFIIGGWLADFLKTKPMHVLFLKKVCSIYSETNLLKHRLCEEYGFLNVEVLPNFRLNNYNPTIKTKNTDELRLVFMSRINKMKGYEMIFELAEYIKNNKLNIIIHFFGPINNKDKDDFLNKVSLYNFVSYKGEMQPNIIHEKLSNYDILLLPTKFYTEGLPGAIVDAYKAGIPVIATKWLHSEEFIDEDETGYIIPFKNGFDSLKNKIELLYNNNQKLLYLKTMSYKKSKLFSPEYAWEIIKDKIS